MAAFFQGLIFFWHFMALDWRPVHLLDQDWSAASPAPSVAVHFLAPVFGNLMMVMFLLSMAWTKACIVIRSNDGPELDRSIPRLRSSLKELFLFFGRKAIEKVSVFPNHLVQIDMHLLVHFTKLGTRDLATWDSQFSCFYYDVFSGDYSKFL